MTSKLVGGIVEIVDVPASDLLPGKYPGVWDGHQVSFNSEGRIFKMTVDQSCGPSAVLCTVIVDHSREIVVQDQ